MEARKITVVSTKTQSKNVIMSGAETLAELKRDLANAGIDYTDMTFYEGVSKTELRHDESILPTNVPYTNRRTGETINTNELVFMLTNQNKKIKSGAYDRRECYDIIKDSNWQNEVKAVFGKNFTQVSTEALNNFIEERLDEDDCEDWEEDIEEDVEASVNTTEGGCVDSVARKAILLILDELYNNDGYLDTECYISVRDLIDGKTPVHGMSSPYGDDEIDDMMEECMG